MSSESRSHELTEASARGIALFGLSLALGAVLMHVCLAWLFVRLKHDPALAKPRDAAAGIAEPRLQPDPQADLQDYLRREKRLLSSYGWIDRKSGIARIPIERAMDLLIGGQAQAKAPARSGTGPVSRPASGGSK